MGQSILYAISLKESCGGFLGVVILGRSFLRLIALDARFVAIETTDSDLQGRTIDIETAHLSRGQGALTGLKAACKSCPRLGGVVKDLS